MQRWIFLQNAAALCPGVSLNGWTLFYRCYGVKEEAMSRFSQFLHADLPAPPAEKSLDPFHPQNTMGDIWESIRLLENDDDDSHGEQVKALVRQLIRETGAVCDEIRLYVLPRAGGRITISEMRRIISIGSSFMPWWSACLTGNGRICGNTALFIAPLRIKRFSKTKG